MHIILNNVGEEMDKVSKHHKAKKSASSLINDNIADLTDNRTASDTHKPNERIVAEPNIPFSVFSSNEKYLIVLLCCVLSFWAAVSGPIFFPALPVIKEQFNISEELSNVAVVLYFLLQGLAPMISCSLSDKHGRRPIIIACGLIYIVANIGLAVCQSFGALLFLRCLQSAGISPMFPISSALVGDVVERHERGRYVGLQSGVPLIGNAIGGLIGGLLVQRFGWRGIFWFLAIGAGVSVIAIITLLPETKRTLVGNGSVRPKSMINKSLIWEIPRFKKKLNSPKLETVMEELDIGIWQRIGEAPKLLTKPEVFLVLIPTSIFYTTWTMLMTTMTNTLTNKYHYSVFRVGLCYLAPGIAGVTSSLICGRIIDWVYARYKKNLDKEIKAYTILNDEEKQLKGNNNTKPEYNAFKARLPCAIPFAILCSCGFLVFGWCIGTKQPLVAVIIGIFIATACVTPFISIPVAMFVDLYPLKAATSIACINLGRCGLAACGVAALDRMQKSLTTGGVYTLMVAFGCISLVPFCVVIAHGKKWYDKRN